MILDYKNTPVFYTDEGSGIPIVLLHGFLENSGMWDQFKPVLIKNQRVITIDLLGHGQTGNLGYIHTMEMMAEAVAYILQAIAVNKAWFFGHSMGGYVSLALAELYPQLILGLGLINSTPFPDSSIRQENRDRAVALVKQNSDTFVSMAISNLFTSESRLSMQEEISILKQDALKMSVQGIVAALEGMKIRKDRSELLIKSDFKKSVVLGIQDPVLDYIMLTSQLNSLSIDFSNFEGGHMLHIENFHELSYFMMHFIES